MRFEFATAGRIVFGEGTSTELPEIAAGMGYRPFLVCGRGGAKPDELLKTLNERGQGCALFTIDGEPTVEDVRRGAEMARSNGCDLVVALGGGSVIDAGKAVSAMAANSGDVLDYLEVIGVGKSITQTPLPMIAVPTTAGTGAEVTRNAVITSTERQYKASMRSPLMIPRVALVDPKLTLSMPPAVTASTGVDALTQLIEPFTSVRANPLTDALCREGIRLAAPALRKAYHDGSDLEARKSMSAASLFGGLALANAGLGAVHGFASPIGGLFPAPHGAICARLLALVVTANIRALEIRAPGSAVLEKYTEVSRILTGSPQASFDDGIAWLALLAEELQIPRLGEYGLTRDQVPEVVEMAARASSMKANPIQLTEDELRSILLEAL
jgi:alcohol dehydrogenase class IV